MFPKPPVSAPAESPKPTETLTRTTGTEAEKQFSCEQCQVVYPNEEMLRLHSEMHQTANNQVCIDRGSDFGIIQCLEARNHFGFSLDHLAATYSKMRAT